MTAATALALPFLVPQGAGAAAGDRLKPDLVTRPFPHLEVRGTRDGEMYLRLSNEVANRGVGPLEIFPKETDTDCDGDGNPVDDRLAFQRIYEDSSALKSLGFFRRSQDTEFAINPRPGCMRFHDDPGHLHWHFEHFARYKLKRESSGRTVAKSTKVSFCVLDTSLVFPGLPGAPTRQYYPEPGASCDATATEGLSIGWSDTYDWTLAGQELEVTGRSSGGYCLISKVDPADLLRETKERNNTRRQRIFLDVGERIVKERKGRCTFRK